MKTYRYVAILSATLFLTGCNPFGKNSIINIVEAIEGGLTTTEINSGGKTETTIPASGLASDIHTISYSVGTPFRQTSFNTGDGHSVNVSISGSKQ